PAGPGHRAVRSVAQPLQALAASAVAVAAATGLIFGLRPVAPVLSLGVLYLLAVLPVAVVWGLPYAIAVSVASMLTLNWFFLPPRHTLALRDSENWVVLGVYLVTGVVVSGLAAASRRRAAEAEQREREAAVLAVAGERERLGRKALEAEALRRSDAIKTAILRAVSHDLRSPLTAIMASVDGLESTSLELNDDDRRELLAAIGEEARRLDRLVGNLLDLSRLEVGWAAPRRELWTLDALVG